MSVVSSSMNSMLSLTTRAFMPVEDPTLSCSIEPVSWSSLGLMPISMAGDLADLAREQTVVAADGAGLGAAPAQVAAVGELASRATVFQLSSMSPWSRQSGSFLTYL
jgi:hypothetical protein